ncbi:MULTISPECIES: dTDP-glucose 4,6-dehydratase [unclassified Pseudofrankia]|uniref:dTDP-glucose 4,6-dehydratase n=1 Tax=unclassified Pseudofrankia TaxID=2994372 RepID=UPI0008DA194B|nr:MULTISPECIES: dTDP-glucose 4,6-dehydratase [unclassified Pseudofrankia]MDT3442567.1 dTDP-glucose 4,6-dehydratase [Pseudofrankia sp. BMG5.37]OHV71797.1 dTDP-glucose 4,6-dehydratase [Pseudofrankia sp. BMG5.36]
MATLLVTGGAGFIGSNFVRYWVQIHPDDSVVALDALTYAGRRENLADVAREIAFVHADIRDQAAVVDALREHSVDVVVNFAAESHNSLAIIRPGEFFATNVMGTQALLEAVRTVGVARFHQISTCEVYGDMDLEDPGAFTEDSPYLPRTPYNAAKAGGDHVVRSYGHTYGVPVTITNCSNNYGPYQFPEKVIPLFISRALRGEVLPLYASTRNRREWLHVLDHCRAVDAVLTRGRLGETYHVGSGVEADIETIADTILTELGLPSALKTIVPDRPSHDRRYLLDSSKLRRELGWEPRISFADGMRSTIGWYRDNESWWAPLIGASPVIESAWATTGQ